jgi:hypothetical protein
MTHITKSTKKLQYLLHRLKILVGTIAVRLFHRNDIDINTKPKTVDQRTRLCQKRLVTI